MDYYKLKVLNNKRIIIVISVALIFACFSLYFIFYKDNDDVIVYDTEENRENEVINAMESLIFVDIKGCIQNPGVYSFRSNEDARVNDLITKAGGLTEDADTSLLNLSKKLEDEMTIIIYSHREIDEYVSIKEELLNKLDLCEIKLKNNACNTEKNENSLININTATKEELMNITGIGETKADAIIEYRKDNKFTKIEDIKNVDGIGESLFEKIKEKITV